MVNIGLEYLPSRTLPLKRKSLSIISFSVMGKHAEDDRNSRVVSCHRQFMFVIVSYVSRKEAQRCYCCAPNCRGWIGGNEDEAVNNDEENKIEPMETDTAVVRPQVNSRVGVRKRKKPATPAFVASLETVGSPVKNARIPAVSRRGGSTTKTGKRATSLAAQKPSPVKRTTTVPFGGSLDPKQKKSKVLRVTKPFVITPKEREKGYIYFDGIFNAEFNQLVANYKHEDKNLFTIIPAGELSVQIEGWWSGIGTSFKQMYESTIVTFPTLTKDLKKVILPVSFDVHGHLPVGIAEHIGIIYINQEESMVRLDMLLHVPTRPCPVPRRYQNVRCEED
jgi:hypothetical protein